MSRYVDAEQLKHIVNEKKYNARNKHFFFDCIYECDTADVAPVVHASWVGTDFDGYADGYPVYDVFECSNCNKEHYGEKDTLTAYCPHCGAKMDE